MKNNAGAINKIFILIDTAKLKPNFIIIESQQNLVDQTCRGYKQTTIVGEEETPLKYIKMSLQWDH